jgi:hypothetical protein
LVKTLTETAKQTGKTSNGETLRVREVWASNLEAEVAVIRSITGDYPYVAMVRLPVRLLCVGGCVSLRAVALAHGSE